MNEKIGNWKGKPVYAIAKKDIGECVNGVYYIVFDDENTIIGINRENRLMQYGTSNVKGEVDEFPFAATYVKEMPRKKEKPSPAVEAAEEVVGDVRLGELVTQTLKAAREMTIDSLLEGFEYGLT
jgi:hypothetical protein